MWWYEIHQSIFTHRYQGQNTEDQILSITSRCLSHKLAPASADQGLWDPWNLRLWEHVRAPKYVVSYPTRWSLLFIFRFLYGSSKQQRNEVQLFTTIMGNNHHWGLKGKPPNYEVMMVNDCTSQCTFKCVVTYCEPITWESFEGHLTCWLVLPVLWLTWPPRTRTRLSHNAHKYFRKFLRPQFRTDLLHPIQFLSSGLLWFN